MTGEIMSKETNDSGTPGVVRVDRLVRPAKRATRTETVTVRLDPDTLRSAELVATVTCRTVSSLMQYALQLYIAKNYPEAKTPGARVVARIDEAPDERAYTQTHNHKTQTQQPCGLAVCE